MGSLALLISSIQVPGSARADAPGMPRIVELRDGQTRTIEVGELRAGQCYGLLASVTSGSPGPEGRVDVRIHGPNAAGIGKTLDAGDPDFYLVYRPRADGRGFVSLSRTDDHGELPVEVEVQWWSIPLADSDRVAIEAEPNDTWREANPLRLGREPSTARRTTSITSIRPREGKAGLDWFRFEVEGSPPVLVYFQLDLLDRDVSANLRVYAIDSRTGRPEPYLAGKDPMEIVHDRERERYSKHLSRTFTKGTYFLEVNANHPDYILRTRVLPVPPYGDPGQAVEAGCTTS